MAKKLYRNSQDKIIAGVCSGLGDYLNIDPVIIRIIALGLFFLHGFGLLTYLIAWVIIPPDNIGKDLNNSDQQPPQPQGKKHNSANSKIIIGIIMILFGALIALDKTFYFTHFVHQMFSLTWDYFIPLALIIAGAFILLQGKKNSDDDHHNTTDFT